MTASMGVKSLNKSLSFTYSERSQIKPPSFVSFRMMEKELYLK